MKIRRQKCLRIFILIIVRKASSSTIFAKDGEFSLIVCQVGEGEPISELGDEIRIFNEAPKSCDRKMLILNVRSPRSCTFYHIHFRIFFNLGKITF